MPDNPTDETTESIEKKNRAQEESNKKTAEGSKLQKDLNDKMEKFLGINKETTDELLKRIDYEADLASMTGDRIAQQKAYNELVEELAKMESASYNKESESYEKDVMAVKAKKAALDDLGFTYVKITKSQDKFLKEADSMFSDLATKSGIFGDPNKGMVGSMFKFAASMKNADGAMGLLGASFLKHFNFASLATGIVENITASTIGMIKSFDDASASFAKATGTGDEFAGTMIEMRQEGNAMGVTFENSAAALQSLIETQVGFLHSSKSAQKEMATQVALMERIGISSDTSAEMMNVFTINMGESQKTAIQMTKSLASMGSVLGNSQKFLKSFQESLKSLAVYGDGAVDVFSNMAAAARAAGVEVATLTGLASKFDTFADAADAVGKLNALLGSQMSSTEMLLMTEDQRVETLIQQVQISGDSFAQMDRFKQKAIANAAGITDMNEAQRIFGMSMKDYKRYQKDMERQSKLQDNFNKAIEATIPLQEKVKQFFAEFAIYVKPTLDILSSVIGFITDIMSKAPESVKALMGFVAVGFLIAKAFSGMSIITGAITAIGGAAAGSGASLGVLTTASGPASAGMRSLGASAASAAAGMAGFALPFMGIVGAIAILVLSMGYLVDKLIGLSEFGGDAILVIYGLSGALMTLAGAGALGAFGTSGIVVMMTALATGLAAVRMAIGDETTGVSNALENLALIATGTSAKAMGGATANIATELKGAVQAALTTKIDITLRVNDKGLNGIFKDAMLTILSDKGDAKVRNKIIEITGK